MTNKHVHHHPLSGLMTGLGIDLNSVQMTYEDCNVKDMTRFLKAVITEYIKDDDFDDEEREEIREEMEELGHNY